MVNILILIVAVTLFSAPAGAADCGAIKSKTARRNCVDAASRSKPRGDAPQAAPALPESAVTQEPAPDEFAAAKAAIVQGLIAPQSARFTDLFSLKSTGDGDLVCGMIDAQNRSGKYVGPRGFIYFDQMKRGAIMQTGASDFEFKSKSAGSYCIHCVPDRRGDKKFATYCPSLNSSPQ